MKIQIPFNIKTNDLFKKWIIKLMKDRKLTFDFPFIVHSSKSVGFGCHSILWNNKKDSYSKVWQIESNRQGIKIHTHMRNKRVLGRFHYLCFLKRERLCSFCLSFYSRCLILCLNNKSWGQFKNSQLLHTHT